MIIVSVPYGGCFFPEYPMNPALVMNLKAVKNPKELFGNERVLFGYFELDKALSVCFLQNKVLAVAW